jgi:hypothetical protein
MTESPHYHSHLLNSQLEASFLPLQILQAPLGLCKLSSFSRLWGTAGAAAGAWFGNGSSGAAFGFLGSYLSPERFELLTHLAHLLHST